MATYSSPDYTLNAPVPSNGLSRSAMVLYFPITTTAALTTADVFNFGYVPANFRLVDAILKGTDMDTNGSPTLAINVGISGTAQLIFAASVTGQAGVVDRAMAVAGVNYKFTSKTLIVGAPSANAATGVAGTLELVLIGYVEDSSTS